LRGQGQGIKQAWGWKEKENTEERCRVSDWAHAGRNNVVGKGRM